MTELQISPNFTIDDIHKIREWNAERNKGMTVAQLNEYYAKGSEPFMRVVRAKQANRAVNGVENYTLQLT